MVLLVNEKSVVESELQVKVGELKDAEAGQQSVQRELLATRGLLSNERSELLVSWSISLSLTPYLLLPATKLVMFAVRRETGV